MVVSDGCGERGGKEEDRQHFVNFKMFLARCNNKCIVGTQDVFDYLYTVNFNEDVTVKILFNLFFKSTFYVFTEMFYHLVMCLQYNFIYLPFAQEHFKSEKALPFCLLYNITGLRSLGKKRWKKACAITRGLFFLMVHTADVNLE